MKLYFQSINEIFFMGGHGIYVWIVVIVLFTTLLLLILNFALRIHRLVKEIKTFSQIKDN